MPCSQGQRRWRTQRRNWSHSSPCWSARRPCRWITHSTVSESVSLCVTQLTHLIAPLVEGLLVFHLLVYCNWLYYHYYTHQLSPRKRWTVAEIMGRLSRKKEISSNISLILKLCSWKQHRISILRKMMASFPWGRRAAQHLATSECPTPASAALYLFHSHLLAEVSAPDNPALCCFSIHLHDKESSHLQDVIMVKNLPGTAQLLPVAVVVKFVVAGKRNEDPKPCTQRVKDLGGSINPNLGEKKQIQWMYTQWCHFGRKLQQQNAAKLKLWLTSTVFLHFWFHCLYFTGINVLFRWGAAAAAPQMWRIITSILRLMWKLGYNNA